MKVIQEAQETALTVQAALCTDAAQRESAQPPSYIVHPQRMAPTRDPIT